jgi:hypothetical protein
VAIANIDTRKLTRLPAHPGRAKRLHLAWPLARRSRRPSSTGHCRRQGRAQHGRPGPGQGGVGARPTTGPRPSGSWPGPTARPAMASNRAALSCGGVRLRRQEQHPAHAGRARLQGHRGARADACCRGAEAQARRHLPVQRPRRPGALRLRHCRHPRADRTGVPTFGICLGHQIMALASGPRPSR